jgi:NADP-dependent 3-hydroxy acid dehydrogenase YdfG
MTVQGQIVNSHLPLQGSTAIVTGGSRGIGAGIAIELGRRGADVRSEVILSAMHWAKCSLLGAEYMSMTWSSVRLR